MPFEPGEVLYARFPFTDHSSEKIRPVLVVSSTKFNRGDDFVVVPISSRIFPGDKYGYQIKASDSYFKETGLRYESTVKWTKPMVISRSVVHRKAGLIPTRVLTEIRNQITSLFS